MIPIEHVIPWFFALALFGIAGMVNIWKNQRCRWCPHCLRKDQEEADAREKAAHARYHTYAGGRADECVGDCPGRRK